jgi:hypothetical protein
MIENMTEIWNASDLDLQNIISCSQKVPKNYDTGTTEDSI